MNDFMYDWIEDENSYCVFDDMGEPILDTLEFLQSESNSGAELNTQEGKAVALKLWFEFLDQEGMHYSNVDNKYIPLFRDWLKTPLEHRDMYKRIMKQQEHISSSTWMQYQARVAMFYERYVSLKYPDCKINWKIKISESDWKKKHTHEYMFKEKIKLIAPDSRAIEPEIFKEIRAQTTNKRDALILDFMYVSGLRRGELLSVDCRQFEVVNRRVPSFGIVIHDSFEERQDGQTKSGGRRVFIPSTIAEQVGSYILHDRVVNKNEHYKIFTAISDVKKTKAGDPLTGRYISGIFKNAAVKAGYFKFSIHDCRHSMVTNALSTGNDLKTVMDQAGHTNPNTTMRYRSKHSKIPLSIDAYCSAIADSISSSQS